MIKKATIILLFFLVFEGTTGRDCYRFFDGNCNILGGYEISRQSTDVATQLGKSVSFFLIANEGYEYFVSLCVSKKKNDIHFKIYDMSNPEKPIYDNANDRYMPQILFENEMDRKLRFDVVVKRSKKDVIPDEITCMGFNVQQKMFRIKREKKRAI